MSGRSWRSRRIFSCGRRPSFKAITSITIAPAPRAARWALSPVICSTRPETIIWSPPPALEVDTKRSTPSSPRCGETMRSPSRIFRPASSSTSRTALSTPRVTSSNGASTVVGASPRTTKR